MAAKPKPAAVQATPTVETMPSEQILLEILREATVNPDRGVPTLIGPTQWGKTKTIIEDFMMAVLGIKREHVIMMNPQNDLPEDIGGWPVRDGDWLHFTQPANIPPFLIAAENYDKKTGDPIIPWGIFVDEMDKAREETLSAMLTFFNPDERRLRTTRVHRKVPIIGAMNEPENRIIPEPLLARLLFLPFPPPGIKISDRPHLRPVSHIAEEMFGALPAVRFPMRPRSPGSLHKLRNWLDTKIFWDSEQARQWIVRGLFNEADATVVLSRLRERMPEPTVDWARTVTPVQMIEHIVDVLHSGDYDACVKVLQALEERAKKENDATGEFERLMTVFLMTPEALHSVKRDSHLESGKAALRKRLTDALKDLKKEGDKK